jgi:predicted PurR-regulated permease PerM
MSWKEFLMPEWRKIVVFAILLFILIEFPFILITRSFEITFIISLVISYLFSCLIIWIYDLRKSGRKATRKEALIILIILLIIIFWFSIVLYFGWYHCQFAKIYDGLIYETCRGFTYTP